MIVSNLIRWLIIVTVLLAGMGMMVSGSVWMGLGVHALVMIPLLWGTLQPRSRLFGAVTTHTGDDSLWLTIDDGPDPADTPVLLKLLQKHQVKATFFVVGKKAERYPELIQRIVAEGHSLGNHTWSHPQGTFWCRGPWATYREIARCQDVIQSITGDAPALFRAPVGHSNIFVHAIMKRLGLRVVAWSARGFDAVSSDADEVMRKLEKTMQPGAIVLAHESTPIAAEVVERILVFAESQGWEFSLPKNASSQR